MWAKSVNDRTMSDLGKRGDVRASGELKLIQELKDTNLYEDGMTTKDMQAVLDVLKESKDAAKSNSQNRITKEMPESQQQANQPSHSSTQTQRSTTSPVFLTNQHNAYGLPGNGSEPQESLRHSFQKHEDKESKDLSTKMNKARNSIIENTRELGNENKHSTTKTNSQLRNEVQTPKWEINPLDYKPNAKDKALNSFVQGSSKHDSCSTRTLASINKDIAQLSLHLQKVSDACRSQRWAKFPSNSWGTAIKVGTANGSLDRRAVAIDTPEKAEEPLDEPTHNVVNEMMNGRRRRPCVERVDVRVYNESDDNDSDEEFETRQKKRKPTNLEDLIEESRNSRATNLNVNSENSKRRKLQVKEDEYDWGDIMMASSDEEDAEKPTKRKKAKISAPKKPTIASSSKAKNVELVSTGESKDNPVDKRALEQICIDDLDEVTICDDAAAVRSHSKRSKRGDATETTSSVYPRRIVPPHPGGKFLGLRARRPQHTNTLQANKRDVQGDEDDAAIARMLSKGKGKIGLQDGEIAEDVVEDFTVDTVRIAPLRPSSRLRMQAERLRDERQKEDETKLIHLEQQRIKNEEGIRRKVERVRQRVQEQSNKARLEERNERRKLALEQTWRDKMKAKEKQRQTERTELNPEGPRQSSDVPSVEVVPENHYEMEHRDADVLSGNKRGNLSQSGQVPCPICSKDFPVDKIEAHAAHCEEYNAASSAGGSRSNSPDVPMYSGTLRQRDVSSRLFTCDVCSKFTARDGREFEDHVTCCLQRRRDGVDDESGSVVMVPDSPIRSVKKHSEQTDSEINYVDQLVRKPRSNSNTTVKRKRR